VRDKNDLRLILRQARKDFVLERQNSEISANNAVVNNLLILINGLKSMSGYCAIVGEPDVMSLVDAAAERGVVTALPYIDPHAERREMTFLRWEQGDVLVESQNRFLQPPASGDTIAPDLILTPLLGFDRAFNRLGQGGGDYDRAFARYPDALRIGIAWSVQEIDAVPIEPWDVPLDAVLTEREWIKNPAGRLKGDI
jgi:5-formyltetrahydrofolate cyclo-ligase